MVSAAMSYFCACAVLLSTTVEMVQSRYVFHTEIQREISQRKLIATWEEAAQRCKKEGAILASPLNAELLKYMKSVIAVNNHTTPYFIGTKLSHDGDLRFITEEGIELEDVSAAVEMVEQLDPRAGACLCMDAHSIRAVPCWTRLPYMCYKNVTSTTPATTGLPLSTTPITGSLEENQYGVGRIEIRFSCEQNGYKLHGSSCYKLHNTLTTWDDANRTCEGEGAYLVIINDDAEVAIIKEIAKQSPRLWFWVGVRHETGNNDWISIHGDRLNDIYHVMSPSYTGANDCCGVTFTGKLDDVECESKRPFICEIN